MTHLIERPLTAQEIETIDRILLAYTTANPEDKFVFHLWQFLSQADTIKVGYNSGTTAELSP